MEKAKTKPAQLESIHTPATLANIFAGLIMARQEQDVLFIQGVYSAAGRKNYGGMFYDQLKDEVEAQMLIIKVPAVLRPRLAEGHVYLLKGYLERKIKDDSNIELRFSVVDCISEQRPVVSDETAKVAELLRAKADEGYIDVGAGLKRKLLLDQRPQIALIYGHSGIVNSDVTKAIREAVTSYSIEEHRVNLGQKQEIVRAIKGLDKTRLDMLAIVRGGGSGLDIFNDREIAQAAIDISVPFVSAIGHAEDVTLVEKVADRKFATPTALGNFLREIVEQVAEERIGSRARLAAELEQTYKKQLNDLDNRNKSLYMAKLNLEKQVDKSGAKQARLLIAGVVIGVLLGLMMVAMF